MKPGPDASIRAAALAQVEAGKRRFGGAIPWTFIAEGFTVHGQRIHLATKAKGIFKPAVMFGLLSVKTVMPRGNRRAWYHDQRALGDIEDGGPISYAFRGSDPGHADNRLLRDAMIHQLPIIYFLGVAPAVYLPISPVFVTGWDPDLLSCQLSPIKHTVSLSPSDLEIERTYALREVAQRVHQARFRERVLAAYESCCALTGLPERRLIDAAHIMPDGHPRGQPLLRNGICMSKLHHAAFDSGLIGIDPDYRVHVSQHLLDLHDGPLLEHALKPLAGRRIRVPKDAEARPDRDRLAERFAAFEV